MRIRHNIPGMNTFRAKCNATKKSAKTLEKLSTGYRINRSADDAAGLSVSEKMRISITGLNRAVENSSEGINLIQIAEGAMGEMHDMIDRMFSLAEQSRNGTYTDQTDRVQLDKEYQNLILEIDRIADSTSYSDIKLLDGSNMRHGKDPAGEIAQRIATLIEMQAAKPAVDENGQLSETPAATRKAQVAGMNQNAVVIAYASGDSENEVREIREKASEDHAKMEAEQPQTMKSGGSVRAAELPEVPAPVNTKIDLSGYTPDEDGVITINEDGRIDLGEASSGRTIQIAAGCNVTLEGSSKDVKIVCADNVTLHLDGVKMENTWEDGRDDNIIDIQGKGCILNLIGERKNELFSSAEIILTPGSDSVDEKGRLKSVEQTPGKSVIHVGSDAELTISGEPETMLETRHTKYSFTEKKDFTPEYFKDRYIKENGLPSGSSVNMDDVLVDYYRKNYDYYKTEYIRKYSVNPDDVTEADVLRERSWENVKDDDREWRIVGKADGGKKSEWDVTAGQFIEKEGDLSEFKDYYGAMSAVIGGDENEVCGSITIAGGSVVSDTIFASYGAAIGSGNGASGGEITIKNGKVEAYGYSGAGIGGGNGGDGGTIIIEGGTVEAQGDFTGAGIGGGMNGAGGEITITNGASVTANNYDYGAGIGSGWSATGLIDGGKITISGEAAVTAFGGGGAGIGGGENAPGGEIFIKDQANVTATGGHGAGIGGGYRREGGNITVSGGNITVYAGYGAGLGGGDNASCGNIVIEGGTVNAATNNLGAGIGNGSGLDSTDERAAVGSITITGPNTTVNASNGGGLVGAAIGDGAAVEGNGSRVYTPEINVSNGASVTVTSDNLSSGAAIGGGGGCFLPDLGEPSEGGKLNINGGTVTVNSGWIGGGADFHMPDVIYYANDGSAPNITDGTLNYTDPRPVDRTPHDETDPPPDEPDPPPVGPDPSPADRIPHENTEEGGGLILQIGETNETYNRLYVYIDDMHASAMGLDKTNILTQDNAAIAMMVCRWAKNYVSSSRGDMGAYINRLEHNINSLTSAHENIVDAESTIRDTSVADETLKFTKYNILNQSAQAMLAQANQMPNGVLQLLQQ